MTARSPSPPHPSPIKNNSVGQRRKAQNVSSDSWHMFIQGGITQKHFKRSFVRSFWHLKNWIADAPPSKLFTWLICYASLHLIDLQTEKRVGGEWQNESRNGKREKKMNSRRFILFFFYGSIHAWFKFPSVPFTFAFLPRAQGES